MLKSLAVLATNAIYVREHRYSVPPSRSEHFWSQLFFLFLFSMKISCINSWKITYLQQDWYYFCNLSAYPHTSSVPICSLLSQAWATAVQSPGALFSTRNAASVCMNMIWSDSLTAASSADLWPSTCCCRRAGPLLHRHSRKFYYNLQETEVQADYVLSYSSSSDLFLCTSLSAARSSVPSIRLLPPKRRLWGGTMCITPPGQGCQTATTKTHSSPMNTHFLTIWIHVSICILKPARESVPLIPG